MREFISLISVSKRLLLFLFAALLLFGISLQAHACIADLGGPMPSCSLPAPEWSERKIIISGSRGVPTNLRFGEKGPTASLTDVRIKPGSGPIYFILSHDEAAIYRFSGAVEEISRIAAMGSTVLGPDYFGIIGVPASKVLPIPVKGLNKSERTICAPPPKACIPDQFFAYSGGFAGRQAHYRQFWKPALPKPYRKRWWPNNVIRVQSSDKSPIVISPDMPRLVQTPSKASSSDPAVLREWRKRWDKLSDLEKYRESNLPVEKLDLKDVFSPKRLVVDDQLLSWEGLAVLERQGAIYRPDSPRVSAIVAQWRKAFSARFQTRLDPELQANPVIDFVVTDKIRMPRGSSGVDFGKGVTFLIAPGVPLPESSVAAGLGGACLYFADNRSKLPRFQDYRCEMNRYRIDNRTRLLFASEQRLKRTKELISQRFSQGEKLDDCRVVNIPADAKIIALATYSGVDERDPTRLGQMGCLISRRKGAKKKSPGSRCPEGRITVDVKSSGKVFLILQASRPVRWKLNQAAGTQIVGALNISAYRNIVDGLPVGAAYLQIDPRVKRPSPCYLLRLAQHTYIGGPAAELLDLVVHGLSGRHIDRFVRKPYVGGYGNKTEIDDLQSYSRFTIE